jgi:hypothetical protein
MMASLFASTTLFTVVITSRLMAADLPLQVPPPPAATERTRDAKGFAPPDATCLEWTDGCRTCQRPPGGEATCSNVGIACVPQAIRCTRR